jgi:hypothetical protein
MPRQPETIQGLSNQALVQVEIVNGKIHLYPQRSGETMVYNAWDPPNCSPAKPHEVRWVVKGLQQGQFLRIEPKNPGDQTFGDAPKFDVPPGFNSITSGPPALRAGPGASLVWAYSIVLCEKVAGKVQELSRLDPDVVIKDDP